jgi:hypothetical protein
MRSLANAWSILTEVTNPLDKGWWPIEPFPGTAHADWVSPGNAGRLRCAGSPLALCGRLHARACGW